MSMYAIGILPLILRLKQLALHIWYADDSSAAGAIKSLRKWWDELQKVSPSFGYFPNPSKCLLVVKEQWLPEAQAVFGDTGIQLTSARGRYLGSVIGVTFFKEAFVREKVDQWVRELEKLADVAASQPQAAYSALVFSLKHKGSFLARTTRGISEMLHPVEYVICQKVIPAITGKKNISDAERGCLLYPRT